jgi:hypothetical protein
MTFPRIVTGLTTLNRLLLVGTLFLLICLIGRTIAPPSLIPVQGVRRGGVGENDPLNGTSEKPKGGTPRRNVFRPLVSPPPIDPKNLAPSAAVAAPVIPIEQLAASYNLVGILAGPPVRAIIEDTISGKTSTLTVGQSLGPLVIHSIGSKSVTLERNGALWNLNL